MMALLVDSCNDWGVGLTYIEWSGDMHANANVVQQVKAFNSTQK